MAEDILEIRWHGRGGQGSKTASILLGKIAAAAGKNIQAFPEYGPERMGAPVLAYTRIKDSEIHQHCQIQEPDVVVVLDPTLIGTVDVAGGMGEGGKLIINSSRSPEQLREEYDFPEHIELYALDANKISEEEIGKPFPNTPMLGAVNKITVMMDDRRFLQQAKEEFGKKFAGRQEIIEGNINSVQRAYQEVKGA
ncbi:MAG: 2-oxoacid:acceptor oxidoreductase family protein [Halanaerobiaceae bacterium]